MSDKSSTSTIVTKAQIHQEPTSCDTSTEQDSKYGGVTCDSCGFNSISAGVTITDEIKNQVWHCTECRPKTVKSTSRKSSKSKSSSTRVSLHLQRLEEEYSLAKQRSDKQRALAEKREKEENDLAAELDKIYLDKRYELLHQLAESEDDDGDYEKESVKSINSINSDVNQWLQNNKQIEQEVKAEEFYNKKFKKFQQQQSVIEPITSNTQLQTTNQTSTSQRSRGNPAKLTNQGVTFNGIDYIQPLHDIYSKPKVNEQIPRSVQFKPERNMFPETKFNQQSIPQHHDANRMNALSYQELAARQVLSKDLPTFSGRPEEWPLFISNFESSTQICGFTNQENLIRLQKSLKGPAIEAVRSQLLLPANMPNVIATLRMLYGRPEIIIQTLLNQIRSEPAPRSDKLETLVNFALSVQNLCSSMEASDLVSHLTNPMLLQELTDKLPTQIKLNWAMYKRAIPECNISTFASWLYDIAQSISAISIEIPKRSNSETPTKKSLHRQTSYSNTHAENSEELVSGTSSVSEKKCLICSQLCSSIKNCKKFQDLILKDKWSAVKEHNLCRTCLYPHGTFRCKSNAQCGINNCTFRHHPLLHKEKPQSSPAEESASQEPPETNAQFNGTTHKQNNNTVLFRIVPVILYGKNVDIKTFAFLDDGSSLTLIEQELADELRIKGSVQQLCLRWTANTHRIEENSQRVSLNIAGTSNSAKKYYIQNVHTVKSLNLPTQSLSSTKLGEEFPYLKGIPVESYEQAVPRILIGLDNWKLGIPLKFKDGKQNDPIAVKTRLGWNVCGPYKSKIYDNANNNQPYHGFHACDCQESSNDKLQQMVKEYISLDNLGVVPSSKCLISVEDERSLKILEETTIRKGNQFETGLIWKFEQVQLPNSYPMAKKRHQCLENKMFREPQLRKVLNQKIDDYLKQGYIRKLSKQEIQEFHPRIWYLPIFPVINPNKPGKIRIVWDAAAKTNGISLNSMLLKGPDQMASLVGVLHRFRERKVAICGDIREMFHQVHIKKDDQHSQRFLWRNDPNDDLDVFVMKVMTFGASCSPSSAQFVKNKNAQQFVQKFPRAVTAIVENHYVDDLLDSLDTEEEAIQLAQQVKYIHRQGGFEIRNFISNSQNVSQAFGETPDCSKKNLAMNKEVGSEKILGMWWSTLTDTFTYSIMYNQGNESILCGNQKPTKREVLQVLMKIFDPMGLIAHFLIQLKMLLQDIWKSAIKWDDEISDEHHQIWLSWTRLLSELPNIQIPRCYIPTCWPETGEVQLHIFVDASERAYAAVAYLKLVDQPAALVGAKTKVAPLKILSIPRLELQAALLGSRLASSICKYLSIKITDRYFWSDSKTVLCWLNSDQRKYRQFVAFRVGEILENSDVLEWRWIPTKNNVADEATKWSKRPELKASSRWFRGPQFLNLPKDQWPQNIIQSKATEEEIRPHLMHSFILQEKLIEVERFSNWKKLVRTTAFVFRFINNIKPNKYKIMKLVGPISQEEYARAEIQLYRQAQVDCYPDEVSILTKNNTLKPEVRLKIERSSSLYKQSPYLDETQVIRIFGRIDAAANVQFDVKRPILLPKKHYITQLIIASYHRRYHHYNQETVINEIRQKFSIPHLRVALKKVRKNCQSCKNQNAKPNPPEMATLPAARLSSFTRPFSYIGIDYFGPMMVTVGRRTEKRWGVLITCLCIRAIHIEIAHTLTTDSCILNLRNFMARRGTPTEIYSDNGTNFRGANRELRDAVQNLDKDKIAEAFITSTTKWVYIPPASPHMGGSWERLVQSVKKVLHQISPNRNPGDELLRSMLMEVENIVNSRPLSYIPVDDEIDEALTPNHFLLGSSSGVKPVGEFTDDKIVLKKNWMTVQRYANNFWRRWIKEYLPTLTKRTKWFEPAKPIKPGDIVIIVDENSSRNNWQKGKVLGTIMGKDGQVRRATVQTSTGIYERPAVKLAILDVQPNNGTPITEVTAIPGGSVTKAADNKNRKKKNSCHQ